MEDEEDAARRYQLLFRLLIQEGARVFVAIGAIGGFLWLFGEPLAERFVTTVIDTQELADQKSVSSLEHRMDKVEDLQDTAKDDLTKLKTKIENIEDLAKEQRADTKLILQRLPVNP